MIEWVDNLIQFAVLLVCWFYILWKLLRTRRHPWTLMLLCYSCFTLATGYWLLYLSFIGQTPQLTYVSDFGWYASALFLSMLLQSQYPERDVSSRSFLPWLAPVFSAAAFVFFLQWGDVFGNLIAAIVMSCLGWQALRVLLLKGPWRIVALHCTLFYVLEYAVWISSCFWAGDSLSNMYFWIDFLLTVNFVLLLLQVRKAVAKE